MTSLDHMLYQFPQKPKDPQADIQSCWEEKEEKACVHKSHTSTTVLLLLAQYHLGILEWRVVRLHCLLQSVLHHEGQSLVKHLPLLFSSLSTLVFKSISL